MRRGICFFFHPLAPIDQVTAYPRSHALRMVRQGTASAVPKKLLTGKGFSP